MSVSRDSTGQDREQGKGRTKLWAEQRAYQSRTVQDRTESKARAEQSCGHHRAYQRTGLKRWEKRQIFIELIGDEGMWEPLALICEL